jgi:hypothetical protein
VKTSPIAKKTPSKKRTKNRNADANKASGDEEESESTKKKQMKASAKKTPSKKIVKKQKSTSEADEKDDASDNEEAEAKKQNDEASSSKAADESMSLKSDDDNEDEDSGKQPVPIDQDPKIQRFRKYMKAAGIRIVKNSELEAFKSKKARYDFVKKIFSDAGYKGTTLSMKACQKFKLARERAKEIAELDLGNIIESTSGGRTSRSTRQTRAAAKPVSRVVRADSDSDSDENDEDSAETKQKSNSDVFSRMRDLISSDDESDSDAKKSKKEVKSPTTKKIIESDEE